MFDQKVAQVGHVIEFFPFLDQQRLHICFFRVWTRARPGFSFVSFGHLAPIEQGEKRRDTPRRPGRWTSVGQWLIVQVRYQMLSSGCSCSVWFEILSSLNGSNRFGKLLLHYVKTDPPYLSLKKPDFFEQPDFSSVLPYSAVMHDGRTLGNSRPSSASCAMICLRHSPNKGLYLIHLLPMPFSRRPFAFHPGFSPGARPTGQTTGRGRSFRP